MGASASTKTELYELLKKAGHSPAKAAEILLDAKRGDKTAVRWVEIVKSQSNGH